MFHQIIQSAINSGRLKFAHAQENDLLESIGFGDKKLQNWPTSANSCNNENDSEKEDSNSLNNEKDIVHKLQVDDILEDDELSKVPGGHWGTTRIFTIGTKTGYSCCAGKIGQTGLLDRSDWYWTG